MGGPFGEADPGELFEREDKVFVCDGVHAEGVGGGSIAIFRVRAVTVPSAMTKMPVPG